jgi:hypothetical protein
LGFPRPSAIGLRDDPKDAQGEQEGEDGHEDGEYYLTSAKSFTLLRNRFSALKRSISDRKADDGRKQYNESFG